MGNDVRGPQYGSIEESSQARDVAVANNLHLDVATNGGNQNDTYGTPANRTIVREKMLVPGWQGV
jgi:hypothetical protein